MRDDSTARSLNDSLPRTLDLPPTAKQGPGTDSYQKITMDGVIVTCWYGNISSEALDTWQRLIDEQYEKVGGPVGLVICIRETSSPPEGDFRRQAARLMFSDKVGIISLIFEGSGFRAAIVRSVLAMIFTLGGKRQTPYKVTDDVRQGSAWFVENAPSNGWVPRASDLHQVVDALMRSS
ncbi:MAG: hypothetical protein AAF799_09405 [Myxococcota bacterium]